MRKIIPFLFVFLMFMLASVGAQAQCTGGGSPFVCPPPTRALVSTDLVLGGTFGPNKTVQIAIGTLLSTPGSTYYMPRSGGTLTGATILSSSINGSPIGGTTPAAGSFTTLTSSSWLQLATWTTGGRPGSPSPGEIGYNTSLSAVDLFTSAGWTSLGAGGGTPGGLNGQVQYNNSDSFGGLTNTQLTALVNPFSSSFSGAVPASGGGTSNFLRADGTFAVPPGTGGAGVTWPATGSFVVSNGTNTPAGLAPVNGSCAVGAGGAWTVGACAGAGYALPDIIGTYGADPTGAADSTTAFSNAASSGHGVVVESGTYKISGTIAVASNSYLIGVGKQSVTVTASVTNVPMFTFANGVNSAGISGMTITRSVTPVSGGDGIRTATAGTLDDVENIKFNDLWISNQWNGMNLGPTNWGLVRDVVFDHNYSDHLIMFNTTGNSSLGSNPLQWTLDHVLGQFGAGRGFTIAGVGETKSPAPPISVGEWKNVSTFANNGVGIGIFGSPTSPFWGFRLGSNSFIGGDGSTEIYLDTWGGNHIIEADIELAGTGVTGPGCPGSCTAPSGVGYGIYITGANSGVNIKANINANSDDGIYSAANLFGASTAPTSITGSQITNNGVAGASGSQSGVTLAAGSGGGVVISGGYIGCWNYDSMHPCVQQFGLNIATDKISSIGTRIAAGGNTSAPYFLNGITLTSASCLDVLAGGSCNGGSGGGNVSGPGSSTNGYVPQWNGTGGINLSTGLPTATSGNSVLLLTTSGGTILPGVLPLGTNSTIGGIRCDGSTTTCAGGVVSATTGGGGTVTSVGVGTGLATGGSCPSPSTSPITTTGTIAFGCIPNNTILQNHSGVSAQAVGSNISDFLDSAMGNTQGDIIYRSGGGWVVLAPGTNGQIFETQGGSANPQWINPINSPGLSGSSNYMVLPVFTGGTYVAVYDQWGNSTTNGSGIATVGFPHACTSGGLMDIEATATTASGVQPVSVMVGGTTTSAFNVYSVNTTSGAALASWPFYWHARCF